MRHILILFFAIMAFACHSQSLMSISGTVLDDQDSPLPGVSVVQKGTTNGTTTDLKGIFKLRLDTLISNELIISFVGMESATVKVLPGKQLTVKLKSDAAMLQEVVVTGYTVQHKRNVTGAVTKVLSGSTPGMRVRGSSSMAAPQYEMDIADEEYDHRNETGFVGTKNQPFTTFAADVDRASYSNVRRFINDGILPPSDAVRIEEMINYFEYDYEEPSAKDEPIAIKTTLTRSPFNENLELLRVSLQTERIETESLPASNLVFLIDVSGSMQDENKLPLLINGFKLLVSKLRPQDRVSIVTYAGYTKCVLRSTSGKNKEKIIAALEGLNAGGSTAGASGINLAYEQAEDYFIDGGNNRVILATDGDFNVGISSVRDLEKLIEEKRETGVFLSVLGFGTGNYKDHQMETLADKGNGNFAYIDNLQEARKVFISEFGGTLFTVAKDVKIQIEFNPAHVLGYRLIGYENRRLNAEDFDNDQKDAGDLGAGHSMTALYEIIPAGVQSKYLENQPKLKYQKEVIESSDYLTLKMRYKKPDQSKSVKTEIPVKKELIEFDSTDEDFRFATAVAGFGLLLKDSEYKGDITYQKVIEIASKSKGVDEEGHRAEFVRMVKLAKEIEPLKSAAN